MKLEALTVAFSFLSLAMLEAEDAKLKTGLVLPAPEALHTAQMETPASFDDGDDKLPRSFSLRRKMPPARSQGSTNSCVGWSVGYGLLSYLYHDPKLPPRNPHYVYHWASLNQLPKRGAPVEDRGCTFEDGFKAITRNGACDFDKYADFRKEPDNTLTKEAQEYRAKITLPPFELVTSNLNSIKKALREEGGKPLPAGFHLCREFAEQAAPAFFPWTIVGNPERSVQVWCQPGSPMLDGAGKPRDVLHAMLIVGYDDDIGAFEVLNSYGKDWGDDGYVWVDYNFFKSKKTNGKPACCEIIYSYATTRSGITGMVDQWENAFHFLFGAAADIFEPEGYCRVATVHTGRPRIRPEDFNFEMEQPTVAALEALIQKGTVLTLKDSVRSLALRANLIVHPSTGDTKLGSKIGDLTGGDWFQITGLKKVTLHHGKRIEYWAKGFRRN